MTISYYQLAVKDSLHILANMEHLLDKAVAYCAERKVEDRTMLQSRLFIDMLPFVKQVQLVSDFTKSAAARLSGQEPPKMEDNEASFAELKARLSKTSDYLKTLKDADFNNAATRDIVLPWRKDKPALKGDVFLLQYAIPNIYFHITTAYNILRQNGVPVGKMDFIGLKG